MGPAIPPEYLRRYADRQLESWQVLRLFCSFTYPPKTKFVVIIEAAEDCLAFFFINSRPNRTATAVTMPSQVVIDRASHCFLKRDSFIDCLEVAEMPRGVALDQLAGDLGRFHGQVSPAVRAAVIAAVQGDVTRSRVEKEALLKHLAREDAP